MTGARQPGRWRPGPPALVLDDVFAWINDLTRRDRRLRRVYARVVAAGMLERGGRIVRTAAPAVSARPVTAPGSSMHAP